MNISSLLLIIAILFGFQNMAIANADNLTGDVRRDLDSLIPSGVLAVGVMDSMAMLPRWEELQAKFMSGVEKNPEWHLEHYMYKPAPAYHPNYGMSEQEWEEYKAIVAEPGKMFMGLVPSVVENVEVTRTDDVISFKAQGKAAILNRIRIDLARNVVKLDSHTLPFSEMVYDSSSDNAMKSGEQGYKWLYSDPPGTTEADISYYAMFGEQEVAMKFYSVTIGVLDKNGKTFVRIIGGEIGYGEQSKNYGFTFVF